LIGQREHVHEHSAQRLGDLLGRCCGALVAFGDEHRPGELTYFLGQVEAADLHRSGPVDRRERVGSSSHMTVHRTTLPSQQPQLQPERATWSFPVCSALAFA